MRNITINELIDEIVNLKSNHRVNTASAIAHATELIERRWQVANDELNRLRNERAEVANQLYQFGLYLDTDGTIKRLTN